MQVMVKDQVKFQITQGWGGIGFELNWCNTYTIMVVGERWPNICDAMWGYKSYFVQSFPR
jgi:hypothetical protein